MRIVKVYWLLIVGLVVGLVVVAGVFSFGYRLYHNDIRTLTEFSASYENFDNAISAFAVNKNAESESKASDALIDLNAKATFRLSSLIKNDAEAMTQAPEIADLSGRELDSLRAYNEA